MVLLSWRTDRPAQWLSLGLVGVAIASFATFYAKASDLDLRMRSAIAAAVILTYLVYFALVVFSPALQQASGSYKAPQAKQADTVIEDQVKVERAENSGGGGGGDDDGGGDDNSGNTIPADLFGSFTWVTAAVITFYFGGRSIEQIVKSRSNGGGTSDADGNAGNAGNAAKAGGAA
jgi:Kef-type K+ transport system membrane component KefB